MTGGVVSRIGGLVLFVGLSLLLSWSPAQATIPAAVNGTTAHNKGFAIPSEYNKSSTSSKLL